MEDYQDWFQALLPRARRVEEAQRVRLFTGGLLPPLSLQVQMQNPQTLVAAMSLARQFELMGQYTATPAPSKAPIRGVLPTPGAHPVLPQTARAPVPTVSVEGRPVRRLNQTEQEERRRLGLCFNCDEKYSRGHNKVCKCLFFVDSVEEDDDGEDSEATQDVEVPTFSLHAVAGVPTNAALLLIVVVGTASLVALVDTGSTHNFIEEEAALRTGLHIQPRPRLTTTVANG